LRPEGRRANEVVPRAIAGTAKAFPVNDFKQACLDALQFPTSFSVYIVRQLMKNKWAPSLLWITMHDIDIGARRGVLALRRRHFGAPTGLCLDCVEGHSRRAGILGKKKKKQRFFHPAGFWARDLG